MDDLQIKAATQGNDDQNSQSQGGTLVQFPNTNSSVPQTPVQPEPSGSLQKEQEPFPSKPLVPEVVASEPQVEIAPDLEAAGVTEVAQTPAISEELQKAGVVPAGATVPVSSQPQVTVKSPIDEQKAEVLTKGSFLFKNPSSSLLWLALLVLRQLKMKRKGEK